MAIGNVVSILPDREWVRAVEEAIERLTQENERLRLDLIEARR